METLDTLVTYAYDLTLGGGAFYLGTSLIVYLADRWNELEVKPKEKAPQSINIPLELKASELDAISLPEVQMSQTPEPLESFSLDQTEQKFQVPEPSEPVE